MKCADVAKKFIDGFTDLSMDLNICCARQDWDKYVSELKSCEDFPHPKEPRKFEEIWDKEGSHGCVTPNGKHLSGSKWKVTFEEILE
jgi:hypothetical protein